MKKMMMMMMEKGKGAVQKPAQKYKQGHAYASYLYHTLNHFNS